MVVRRSLAAQLSLKKENKLTAQTVSIEEKELSLRQKLLIWFEIQRIYMPCVDMVRPPTEVASDEPDDMHPISAVDMDLVLPHSLTANLRAQLPSNLIHKYQRLRLAQAEDALVAMKRSLRRGATLFDHQTEHIAGTGVAANTRMKVAIQRQNAKAQLDASRYRAAREALLVLDPLGSWRYRLQVLRETDVRPPPKGRSKRGAPSEGRKTLTWIWKVPRAAPVEGDGAHGDDETAAGDGDGEDGATSDKAAEANEGSFSQFKSALSNMTPQDLRVEWAKSLARAERWEEEVALLRREMARTLRFLDFKARRWFERAYERSDVPVDIRDGMAAYACKQAFFCLSLARKFASHWEQLLKSCKVPLPNAWPEEYKGLKIKATKIIRREHRTHAYIRMQSQRSSTQ